MESKILMQKQIKNKRFYILSVLFILAIIYLIELITLNLNKNSNFIRVLEENIREKKVNYNCIEFDGPYLFNLFGLKNVNKSKIFPDNQNIEFQFCDNVENEQSSCIYKNGEKKYRLSGDINGEQNNNNKIKVDNQDNNQTVYLYLAEGDNCKSDQSKKYRIDITLICSKGIDFQMKSQTFDPENNCELSFEALTESACRDEKYKSFLDIEGSRIIIGIVAILLGFAMGILGYKEIRIGLLLVCILGTCGLGYLIMNMFNVVNRDVVFIIVESLLVICGIVIFIFLKKKEKKVYAKIYMIIVGGVCCFFLSYVIYQLFFTLINTKYQGVIQIVVPIIGTCIGVLLGIFVPKYTCIFGSSIIGAYCITRGLSYFLQNQIEYIAEYKIYEFAVNHNFERIKEKILGPFLIYPAIFVVFIIIFIIVQIKLNPNWLEGSYKDLDKNFEETKDLSKLKFVVNLDDNENSGEGETKE